MLLSKIVDNIKSNLGNRVSGTIGNKSTDVAILDAINQTLKRLPVVAFPDYAERIILLTLDAGKFAYDLPVKDINNVSIKFLDILSQQLYDSTDERLPITYETSLSFDRIHDYLRTNDETGNPICFMRYGAKLYFSPTPDATCKLYLRARCTVADLTNANINDELFVSDDWLLPLEAYTTFLLYTSLQQAALASLWYTTYEDAKKESKQMKDRQLSLSRSLEHPESSGNATEDDPWQKTNRRF